MGLLWDNTSQTETDAKAGVAKTKAKKAAPKGWQLPGEPGLLGAGGSDVLNDKDALREGAYGAAMGAAQAGRDNTASLQAMQGQLGGQFDAASRAGHQQIGQSFGQSLAAGSMMQGRAGHAGYGAQMQAGQQAGVAGAGLDAQVAKDRFGANLAVQQGINESRSNAAQTQFDAFQAISKMGTNAENTRKAMADADKEIADATAAGKGWLNDDETSIARNIRMKAARYQDNPEVYQYMMDMAQKIEYSTIDV